MKFRLRDLFILTFLVGVGITLLSLGRPFVIAGLIVWTVIALILASDERINRGVPNVLVAFIIWFFAPLLLVLIWLYQAKQWHDERSLRDKKS